MALSEKVLKFGGHWWKAVTEEYELVVTEDENSNTSNLEQKCKAVIYEMLAFGFKDPVWKSFGYKKVADRGIFFDVFISKKKLELERVLRRELWLASFSVILIWYLEKTKSNFRKNFTAKAMGNFIFLKGDGGNICSALNLKTTDYAFDLIFDGSYQYGLKRFADFEKIFIDRCDKQLNQNIPQNWLLGAADLFSATGELLFFIKQLNELEAEANLGKELNVEEEWYLLVLDDMLKEIAEIKIRIGASGERQTFEKLKPFVYQGDAKYQDTLAGMYIAGDGVIKDYIQAHKWFNIAEANGHEFANRNKTHIEKLMTSAQIAEAQKLAREWMEKHKK
ncbi:MAG: sel1 repeat family protein [Nitrospinae bacterium]|nr:sel1 repeat family protein [Nitrospinota bacterium]